MRSNKYILYCLRLFKSCHLLSRRSSMKEFTLFPLSVSIASLTAPTKNQSWKLKKYKIDCSNIASMYAINKESLCFYNRMVSLCISHSKHDRTIPSKSSPTDKRERWSSLYMQRHERVKQGGQREYENR